MTNIPIGDVTPRPELGSNFAGPALRPLHFGVESKVWGSEAVDDPLQLRASDECGEPKNGSSSRCAFCGAATGPSDVHHLNGNHRDPSKANSVPADVLCHGWQHLEAQDAYGAVIAYLPGLSAQDVNHLQRTLIAALNSADSEVRSDAKELINFLASHREYCKSAWGSNAPSAFAAVLQSEASSVTQSKDFVFEDLAIVHDPKSYREHARLWAGSIGALTRDAISRVYHRVVNSPY